MITVGLDFGTHQTKVCVEIKEGTELNYEFFKFKDAQGNEQYTLPSIIRKEDNGCLSYGYLSNNTDGEIVRYFKQAVYSDQTPTVQQREAMLYSIWYIAFILFDLEEKYGQDFVIQMGVPTDGTRFEKRKRTAVRLLASAYKLVEDDFKNDKKGFLNVDEDFLRYFTTICDYSDDLRDNYGMLVFPEAYACLKPLTSSSRIPLGMSLMVDIGGGTTDISFFTIEKENPQVYDFFSINCGLNFLTNIVYTSDDRRINSNVESNDQLLPERIAQFENSINRICQRLITNLQNEFRQQCKLKIPRLMDALRNRPIIYVGGGSTFRILRSSHHGFSDIKYVAGVDWRKESITNMEEIEGMGLCPILSTAYGLSIHVADDNIRSTPFRDIFESIRGYEEYKSEMGHAYDRFSYDDYDAWK